MIMRIMHVEDEMIVSMAVRSMLEKNGHTVCAQPSTGIMLGGELDGIETAARLKAAHDVPVIFVSAYGDDKTRERAKATRPDAFLVKPLDMRILLRTLSEMRPPDKGGKDAKPGGQNGSPGPA
mgnify:CR=1 FL=1